jgi:hypothetical protein
VRAATRESLGWSQNAFFLHSVCWVPAKESNTPSGRSRKIARRHPDVLYVVAGATHPNLLRQHGEQYRESLEALAEELGVQDTSSSSIVL